MTKTKKKLTNGEINIAIAEKVAGMDLMVSGKKQISKYPDK